ncbi:MAG: hypothetical protein U0457_21625 [Candidatus Sericytochromatia bacterium]
MTDINSVSNTASGFYTQVSNGVQNVNPTQVANTVKAMPSDTLQIGATSLVSGISVSRQIVNARASELPDQEIRFHSGASLINTTRNAAIVGGIISTAQNLNEFVKGTITGPQATGNITADVVGAVGGGVAAAGAGTLATTLMGSSMGAGITGLLVGTAAFVGSEYLYRNSGIYSSISTGVSDFITKVLQRIKPGGGW